jgi:hypothetical protein
LADLARSAVNGDNEKRMFAEHFEFLADVWLSSGLAHTSSRRVLERRMRRVLSCMENDAVDVWKLFDDGKYTQSVLFLRTIPS